jgi:hypothetical protein
LRAARCGLFTHEEVGTSGAAACHLLFFSDEILTKKKPARPSGRPATSLNSSDANDAGHRSQVREFFVGFVDGKARGGVYTDSVELVCITDGSGEPSSVFGLHGYPVVRCDNRTFAIARVDRFEVHCFCNHRDVVHVDLHLGWGQFLAAFTHEGAEN